MSEDSHKDKDEHIPLVQNDKIESINEDNKKVPIDNNKINKNKLEYELINHKEIPKNASHYEVEIEQLERSSNSNNSQNNNDVNQIETEQNEIVENRPFISVDNLLRCQYCGEKFDSNKHLPLLFTCGHFFCRSCIEKYLTCNEGIKCPNDGIVNKKISELAILDKLISEENQYDELASQKRNNDNNTINSNNNTNTNNAMLSKGNDQMNFDEEKKCSIHKNQRLTHYIEETGEIICVYCAIIKMRNNPKWIIKEIAEKCKEYTDEINAIIRKSRKYMEMLQNALNQINLNKVTEEQKVNELYGQFISYLVNNKNALLNKIAEFYDNNKRVIEEKLNKMEVQIDIADKLKKELLNKTNNTDNSNFNELNDRFNIFMKDNCEKNKSDIKVTEYNFAHDDESKVIKYLNNFGDLKFKKKIYSIEQKTSLINGNPRNEQRYGNTSGISSEISMYKMMKNHNSRNISHNRDDLKIIPYKENSLNSIGVTKTRKEEYNSSFRSKDINEHEHKGSRIDLLREYTYEPRNQYYFSYERGNQSNYNYDNQFKK